jgi:hypothetical protein
VTGVCAPLTGVGALLATLLLLCASQNTRSDDAGKEARVVAWRSGMGATDAEEVEHGGLGLEDGAAANGADFDGRHGNGDLEVAIYAGRCVLGLVLKGGSGNGKRTCS